jgi:hypothetical protein
LCIVANKYNATKNANLNKLPNLKQQQKQ